MRANLEFCVPRYSHWEILFPNLNAHCMDKGSSLIEHFTPLFTFTQGLTRLVGPLNTVYLLEESGAWARVLMKAQVWVRPRSPIYWPLVQFKFPSFQVLWFHRKVVSSMSLALLSCHFSIIKFLVLSYPVFYDLVYLLTGFIVQESPHHSALPSQSKSPLSALLFWPWTTIAMSKFVIQFVFTFKLTTQWTRGHARTGLGWKSAVYLQGQIPCQIN